jgi:3-oxoadipate enol-lactonase/4-carboxymuconolactone decarboxylase
MLLATDPRGYAGGCAAVRDMDQRESIARIVAPTLVIGGTHDPGMPPPHSHLLVQRIPGACYVELPAAHLSNVEAEEAFNRALSGFLDQQETGMSESARYDQGMEVRRAVLGDAYVDRAMARRNAVNSEFQELITRYAWGEVWTRPGLPRHTRSLITIAMLIALNRGDEFRLHVRAAANNRVTRDQIKEVLLQSAIYCGVPAANTAFHLAQEVFAEMDAADKQGRAT